MARRRNDGEISPIWMFLVLALPTIVAVIIVGAMVYGAILVLPLLYYSILGARKLAEYKELYKSEVERMGESVDLVETLKTEAIGLRVTKHGTWDARSPKGQRANAMRDALESAALESRAKIEVMIAPYKNAVFWRAATAGYFLTFIGTIICEIEADYALVSAMFVSIVFGFLCRSGVKSVQSSLPQLTGRASILFLFIWLAGGIFCLLTVKAPTKSYQDKTLNVEHLAHQENTGVSAKEQSLPDSKAFRGRYGDVLIAGSRSELGISFRGKEIYSSDALALDFEKAFLIGDDDVLLMAENTGGTACPALYRFIIISKNGDVNVLPEFGSCSDLIKADVDKSSVKVSMPQFTDPFESKEASKNLNIVFTLRKNNGGVYEVTTDRDKKAEKASNNENSNSAHTIIENFVEVRPFPTKKGFLTRSTTAISVINSERSTSVNIESGSEVTVTGISSDDEWFEIEYSPISGKLYVPVSHVATFTN